MQSPKSEKLLYSRTEAAELLGVCVLTVDNLVKRGELQPRYVGSRVLFSRTTLARFAAGVTA
jgi:excisionase family DNA binding protein